MSSVDEGCIEWSECRTVEEYAEFFQYHPDDAWACYKLAEALEPNETTVLPDGRVACKADVYVEAIRLSPDNQNAYLELASELLRSNLKTAQLHDGRTVDAKQLCLICLDLPPLENKERVWRQLAFSMQPDEKVQYKDKEYDRLQAAYEASHLDKDDNGNADLFEKLAEWLAPEQTITLRDGREYGSKELTLQAEWIRSIIYVKIWNCFRLGYPRFRA